MKNPKFIVGSIILIFILIFVFLKPGGNKLPQSLIGDGITLYRTAFNGVETDNAYIHVPFVVESEAVRHLNIGLDLNNDGEINPSDDDNNEDEYEEE